MWSLSFSGNQTAKSVTSCAKIMYFFPCRHHSASWLHQICSFKPYLLILSSLSFYLTSFSLFFLFFLPFIDPRIVSVSPLYCGLPSCLLSLIQDLNFHSRSLTQEVKLNYSYYLAVSLHSHSAPASAFLRSTRSSGGP